MQQADIKDNYFHENLKQYLSRILQHPTSNETSHETQDLESEPTTQVQNANQLTEQQVHPSSFTPATRSGESPTSSTVSAEDMEYSY
jgi:hypothetical protein